MSNAALPTECDREPIHIPGAVQAHGALLALERDGLRVTHASANLAAFIGIDAAAALGCSAVTLFGEELAALLPFMARARPAGSNAAGIDTDLARGRVHLLPFETADGYGIDVFREPPAEALERAPAVAQHVVQSLRLSRSTDGLFHTAVNDVRRLTGYDRVMVCRFGDDGSGNIIAEDHAPGIVSFRGLRYPAGDIPLQAGACHLLQPLRLIVDLNSAPVALLALPGAVATDLDLSASCLRAVSPVHLQYLSNMGVVATAAVSLVVAGRLWGMLLCHHNAAREPSAARRADLALIGQVISGMVGSLLQSETSARRLHRRRALAGIATALAADAASGEAFAACGTHFLGLIPADGVVVTVGERLIEFGHTPAPQAFRTLMAALVAQTSTAATAATDARASDSLADASRLTPQELDGFLSALLLPLPHCVGGSIVWLRRSAPWLDAELADAKELRTVIEATLGQERAGNLGSRPGDSDELTGLLNRQSIERLLRTAAERAVKPRRAIAIANIDRFSQVNERLGHAAADAVLVSIAERLKAAGKPGDLVARMGPDEFGVLSTTGGAPELAARLTAVFSQPFVVADQSVRIQASIGVGDTAPTAMHTHDVLRSAEAAMREAKKAGGGRVAIFAEFPAAEAARRVLIEQSLEAALRSDRDQFQLALQPIVDAGSGAIISWEVLIRWTHPVLGMISPAEFIPIAESSGLIEAVGNLVLEASLRHLVEVPASLELIGRDVSVSVNVSPLQLMRESFAAEIGAMLDARGIGHARLCLEVTEAAFANSEAVATIMQIRRLGILVAIDAFGIGNSSLSNLQQLPADIVKLDRSFLPASDAAVTGGRSFLTVIIELAHAAGLRVVLEGVENQVQLNAVVAAGADAVQGYLLGMPMPARDATAMARQNAEDRSWQPQFAAAALVAAGAPLAEESPGILERLRVTMRSAHDSIESVPRFGRLHTPDLTTSDYVDTLRRLHAFQASIEAGLAQSLRGKASADALLDGSRLAALAADLAWFGAVPLEEQRLPALPTSMASALGALYAIEVTNLGARVVGRQVAMSLGVGPGTGGSYHCGLTAEEARRRWRLLQELLRVEIDEHHAPDEPVVAAALATFAALELWMGENDAPLERLAS